MKSTIYKDNIIFMALVYNYIANKEKSLSIQQVSKYVEIVNNNLKLMDSKWEVVFENNTMDSQSKKENQHLKCFYGIEKDDKKQKYTFKYDNAIDLWYDLLPDEVVSASLQENALSTIFVQKEDLQIDKKYVKKSGIRDIYSLEARRAEQAVIAILKVEGNENIEIGLVVLDQLLDDKGYHVSYICDKPYERANVLMKNNKNPPLKRVVFLRGL